MRRRPNSHASMSLFPFLDTLVCTMGALILMLLAMTPKIKERALARQAAQAAIVPATVEPGPETTPEPEPPPALLPAAPPQPDFTAERQRRREAWLNQADESRRALADRQAAFRTRRRQVEEAEQRLQDLHDQVLKSRLKSENVIQASESLEERAQKLEAQAALIAQKIAETRKNIDLAQRRQTTAKNEYALVAYDGTSGTMRRPIYVECTGRGFRFLPEDETLSPVDLEGFTDSYNPLLAGAQTLIRFWARRKRSAGPAEREPYVLLLVRPSGCFNYYVARKSLSTLGVHWGYELIEEDWKLSVPDPDPVAKTMLKETLDATAQLRRPARSELAAARHNSRTPFDPSDLEGDEWSMGRDTMPGARGSGSGESGRYGRGGRIPRAGEGSAAGSDQADGDSSRLTTQAAGRNGSAAGTGSANGAGQKSGGAAGGGGAGTIDGSPQGDGSSVASAASGSAASRGSTGGSRGAQPAGLGGGSRTGRASEAGGNAQPGVAAERGSQGAGAAGISEDGSAGRGTGDPAESGGASGARDAEGGGPRQFSGGRGTGRRARPASLGTSADSDGTGDGDGGNDGLPAGIVNPDELLMTRRGAAASGDGSDADPDLPSGAQSSAGRRTSRRRGDGGTDASVSSATGDPSQTADGAANNSPSASWLSDPNDGSAAAGGASPQNAKMGGPGVKIPLGGRKRAPVSGPDDSDNGPRISEDQDKPQDGPAVRSRGPRKWGQVGRRAGIGFEKKIKIYLNDKRIVVDSREHSIPVHASDSSDEIVNRVVLSIDQVADSWGEPPSNFYWVPVVKFVVYPGGNANYAKLQSALEHTWGVASTVEYATDRNAKKAAGGKP